MDRVQLKAWPNLAPTLADYIAFSAIALCVPGVNNESGGKKGRSGNRPRI